MTQPWLARADWRRRELRHVSGIGAGVFALGTVVFGGLAFGWFSLNHADRSDAWLALLFPGIVLLVPVGLLARGWWRRLRHGESVCRLLTLPGVVGGWLRADVECNLRGGGEARIVVWLINRLRGANMTALLTGAFERDGLWRMSQEVSVAVAPAGRTVIPVRLHVPRDPRQYYRLPDGRPNSPASHLRSNEEPAWVLVLAQRRSGRTDFLAMFEVPVFDAPDAPAPERGDAAS
jgi:hypothetical protein